MKLTAQVKLQPTQEQAQALLDTLRQANAACDAISQITWDNRTFHQFGIHKLCYQQIKGKFGLTAQVVVRCISKVADAYKLDKRTRRTFKPLGAIAYDVRILRWYVSKSEISIWTVAGRERISFVCGARQRKLLSAQRGESDLAFIDGSFYLFATCEVEEATPADIDDVLGVDLGVNNIAADSDGNRHAGHQVNGLRKRHAKLRAKLQTKGTKASRRLLKKRRRKEYRFAKHVNHCIAKELIGRAKDTAPQMAPGIALEELTGIRERVTVGKAQRRQHSSWSFAQLRAFIEYKARQAGVRVVMVDPRNTSRTCPACGRVDKRNRPSQSIFSCIACGFCGHADTIAAENIRRAAVNRPDFSTTLVPGVASGKSPCL
jgi:IS605 OrfB family transposase